MTRVDILVKNNKTRCTDFVFKTVHASTIECAKTKPFQTQEYIFAKNDEHLAYEWLYERKDDFEIFFECMTNSRLTCPRWPDKKYKCVFRNSIHL